MGLGEQGRIGDKFRLNRGPGGGGDHTRGGLGSVSGREHSQGGEGQKIIGWGLGEGQKIIGWGLGEGSRGGWLSMVVVEVAFEVVGEEGVAVSLVRVSMVVVQLSVLV